MTPILTSAQMREADRRAIEQHAIPGLVLMENASRGSCDILSLLLESLEGRRIAVLCGKGNNGGDGLALARHAVIQGADVLCILLGTPEELSADARAQYDMLVSFAPECIVGWEDFQLAAPMAGDFDAIVDAMLGTGATGALRESFAEAVGWANDQDAFRFALDIPTGIDADTGIAEGAFFHADATATMAAMKPGLLLGDGAGGDVHVVSIGAPPLLYQDSGLELLDADRAAEALSPVEHGRNKYDRGKVLVVAGSRGMTGAGVMAAEAALRAGSGLVVFAFPETSAPLPQAIAPEIMTRPLTSTSEGTFAEDAFTELMEQSGSYAVIAVGPGMGRSQETGAALRELVAQSHAPLVLDADGLNAFAGRTELLSRRSCELVITPHHGEMARLLDIDRIEIGRNPLHYARQAAQHMNCIVVLKGAPTVVALPDGHAWINSAGNPGMATGGTGDVLTGMIASLIGQAGSAIEGTLAAVYLHSLAADIAADAGSVRSLVATDLIRCIPDAYRSLVQ